jgi:hypothetical protein
MSGSRRKKGEKKEKKHHIKNNNHELSKINVLQQPCPLQ